MASDALRKDIRKSFAEDFVNDFDSNAANQYLLAFGKVDSWVTEPYGASLDNPVANIDSEKYGFYAWADAIGAKRLSSRNVYRMIPRYDWLYGATFDRYDSSEALFLTTAPKRFYVYTSSGNVYKCLNNNSNGVSIVEPSHTITENVTLADGYVWKFIYKVTEDSSDFITSAYIPVQYANDNITLNTITQWNAQLNAVNGSIDIVNTVVPSSEFTAAQWTRMSPTDEIRVVQSDSPIGSTSIHLDPVESASDDFYVGYSIYINSGPGIGLLRKITGYTGSDKTASFSDALTEDVAVAAGGIPASSYVILPSLVVDGDGSGAQAIPIMNSQYNITGVTVLDIGTNYTIAALRALPIEVSGGTLGSQGILGPTFEPQISPYGGHAKNALDDFSSDKVMIRTRIQGTDSKFATTQDFRQVFLLRNPLLNGGTYDGLVAGSEILQKKQLTVRVPYFANSHFNDSTFSVGNSIVGETSKATANIEGWSFSPSEPVGTLELSGIQGNFRLDDPTKNNVRAVFGVTHAGLTFSWTVGNLVKQHNTSTGVTAVGRVELWNSGSRELIINVTSNSYTGGYPFKEYYPGASSDVSTGNVWDGTTVVEREYGELIKHFSGTPGSTFEFYPFSGFQNVARVNRLRDIQDEDVMEKSYRLTHRFVINDPNSALTDATFTADGAIYQVLSDVIKSAKIVRWSKSSGSTGDLYVNSVLGDFTVGGYSGSGDLTIVSVEEPELKIGSGELTYIQNIKPITRSITQDEEIKILIGF